MKADKTSTFTIHHDTCKPEAWTPNDVLQLAKFVQTGDLRYAASLARMGVQLVMSEHHVPVGGTLEQVGWADPANLGDGLFDDLGEAVDATGDEDVTELCRIYRGPAEYVARFFLGDGDGGIDGRDFEIKPTREEAQAFMDSFPASETEHTRSDEALMVKGAVHDSDCATHNEPAMPNGPCDCSAAAQSS